MMKIHVLSCGSTIVDEALPLSSHSRNPLAYTGLFRGKRHKIEVPVRAYLIEHPEKLILVDTGWDTAIRENPRKYEGFINYFASPGFLPMGQSVPEHLLRLGYQAEDLDYVIMTHMDIDHAGGIRLVKNAKTILASEAEWHSACGHHPRYLKRLWKNVSVQTFPDQEVDLLGDGSVLLLPMHGHSAGMTSVKVSGDGGYMIIAGDAGYARESWEKEIPPGITWNKEQARQSLKKLHAFGTDPACKGILMTHDTEESFDLIEL